MNQGQTNALNFPMTYPNDIKDKELATIQEALGILEARIKKGDAFTNPSDVKNYCRLQLANELDEYFGCMFLDSGHHLIGFERLFRGTVDGAAVYPRVVVRRALKLNAAAVIFTHNHPSGRTEPSDADIKITTRLKEALTLVDVRVLDHIIVSTEDTYSMAENRRL